MIKSIRGHSFFANNLDTGALVLDLGAHVGEFATAVRDRYGVRCVAVEPNAELASRIPAREGLEVVGAAFGDTDGAAALHVDENPEASSVRTARGATTIRVERVRTVSLESLLSAHAPHGVALAKVDVEGGEAALTTVPPEALRQVAQFTVEFHVSTGSLPAEDLVAIRRHLMGAGFELIRFSRTEHDWLFFQPERCGVNLTEILLTRHVVRNVRGLGRIARRRVPIRW